MQLKERIEETSRAGQTALLPFFRLPAAGPARPPAAVEQVVETFHPVGIGLIYPGRHPVGSVGGRRAARVNEWDLFAALAAWHGATGLPTVLALDFADITRFGIYPYGREGYRAGLSALLVSGVTDAELDFFSAEIAQHGLGLGFSLPTSLPPASAQRLWAHTTALGYFPDGPPDWLGPSPTRPVFLPAGHPGPATGRVLEIPPARLARPAHLTHWLAGHLPPGDRP